jgi:hypothetical protein
VFKGMISPHLFVRKNPEKLFRPYHQPYKGAGGKSQRYQQNQKDKSPQKQQSQPGHYKEQDQSYKKQWHSHGSLLDIIPESRQRNRVAPATLSLTGRFST